MRQLKLFEDFNQEDIEDILLKFIDDGVCDVFSDNNFKIFTFKKSKNYLLNIKNAEDRLKNRKSKNWIVYKNYIVSYSDKMYNIFNKIFNDLNTLTKYISSFDKNGTIYVDKNNQWIFCLFDDNELWCRYLYLSELDYYKRLDDRLMLSLDIFTRHFFELKTGVKVKNVAFGDKSSMLGVNAAMKYNPLY